MIKLTDVIYSLRPNNPFHLSGDTLDGLVFDDPLVVVPTDAEITTEHQRLQAEYDSNQYQRDRAIAYPSLQDQADMQYWDAVNGTTTWQDAIAKVKADYPKG